MTTKATASGSGSLYVGDLHQDVTEAVLFEVFKELGPIISIRVCRDTVTRTSLGYAYVNFQNPVDAERAIETLNHTLVKERPMRIMWSQRDPTLRRSGVGNVFVKNLDKSMDNRTLYDTFSVFGNILSCKVVYDEKGVSKGYGFVHFDTQGAATKAVEEMNGKELAGHAIFVGPFIKRSQRMSGLLTRFTNVYVKEIVGMDADELKEKFSKFGEVTSACTKKEPRFGEKTFGFVNFATHDMAVKAIEEFHEQEVEGLSLPGSKLYVQRAMKKAERDAELRKKLLADKAKRQFPPANNLYVKNLEEVADDEALKAMFTAFGEITSAVVMRDHGTHTTKGFGFVCFKEASSAQKALTEMNGKMFGAKPLYVNIAQRKDARRSMLELQYAQRRAMPPQSFMTPSASFYSSVFYNMPPAPYYGRGGAPGPLPVRGGKGGKGLPVRGGGYPVRGTGVRGKHRMHPAPHHQPPPQPQQQQQPPPQQQQNTVGNPPEEELLTAERLAAMSPEEQKNTLGEQLFHKITQTHVVPDMVPKITGMLLEMDVSETLNLLESPEVLNSKIEEALQVLKTHDGTPE